MSTLQATRDVKEGLKGLLQELHLALHHLHHDEPSAAKQALQTADAQLVSLLNRLQTIRSGR